MEIVLLLIGLVVGVVVGGLLAWVVRGSQVEAVRGEAAGARTEADAVRHEVDRARAELAQAEHLAEARQQAIVAEVRSQEAAARAEVESRLAGAVASLDELRAAIRATEEQHRAALLTAQEQHRTGLQAAREQHQETLRQHQEAQQERARVDAGHTQVLKTLSPVAEQLRSMQQRVDDMEKARHLQHGELAEQLRTTQHTVAESKRAADTLASALSNNAVRGFWGETQLKTLVESAGLLSRVDFSLQSQIEADSGLRRPDMVINMPGGKQMAIDAKAPYNAYMEACRKDIEPDVRHQYLVEHAKKVRGHVDALASKSYWSGLAASPEFTVAFIPNDQLLAAALDADPSLLEHAFGKGIVLATPANLWAILKTVAFTWRQDVLTEDAKELFDLGRELYLRIVKMAEHAEKLRRSLESTIKAYNGFAGSLESRVLVTARKLDRMDESTVIPTPAMIEEAPRALTSGDFEAIADLDRDELPLGLAEPTDADGAVEAEIVEDSQAG
ncbi:DNA recombination protein RmuC [Nocardioides sp. YIM 152588]|uniref:DNA recombination protein RmuC n=1 Tax=Nocardioides sp. YIM 152588 TaxID=3158259 RepID=UPI0032E4364B